MLITTALSLFLISRRGGPIAHLAARLRGSPKLVHTSRAPRKVRRAASPSVSSGRIWTWTSAWSLFRRGFVQGRVMLLKTEASRTNLPLPEDVLDLLRQWRSITPHPTQNDWVFASSYTKRERPFWPAQLLKTHIKPVALEAGLPNIGWHSFRHSVSAWGKEAGLELEDVKTLLRHENLATTSEIYGDWGSKRSDGFSKG